MKKLVCIIIICCITNALIHSQQSNNQLNIENPDAKEGVEWKSKVVDLGQLQHRVPATAVFEFTNTGEKPVLITNARGSCGCTNIKYTKEPIQPGNTGQVSATYNAVAIGNFSKSVTVHLNIQNGVHVLRLKGIVTQNHE